MVMQIHARQNAEKKFDGHLDAVLRWQDIATISLVWVLLLAWYVIAFLCSNHPGLPYQVDSIYYRAAQHFFHEQPLYDCKGDGCFVYFPTTAILVAPISFLPIKIADVIFRIISASILTTGMYYFCKNIGKTQLKRTFFVMTITAACIAQPAFFVGQLHMITTGLLLLGYAKIVEEKWWQSAILISLALALKPTSIVLYALAIGLFPRLTLKILVVTTFIFLLSLIARSPHYVLSQYIAYPQRFLVDMRFDANNGGHWATFFGAVAFYTHYAINGGAQFLIRMVMAVVVFILSWIAKNKMDKQDALFFIVAIAMTYLMLFNSRSESNDYVMVSPILGYFLATFIEDKKWFWASGFIVAIILITMSWTIAKWLTPHNNIWMNPSVISVFAVYLLWEYRKKIRLVVQ